MLFCEKEECKFRSKRKYKNYMLGNKSAYKCTAKNTVISFYSDGSSDNFMPSENTCTCLTYREREE